MAEFNSDTSVQRVLKNGMFTAFRFGTFTVSSILLIPFLIKEYGSGAYGLIALAGFLTQYVGLISSSVGTAISRFLNIAINKNDWVQANEIFSTSIVANVGFILLQLPLYIVGVWKLDWLIEFSDAMAVDFKILVVCNILIFFNGIITGVLLTPIAAANRLDIGQKLEIVSQLLRVVLLFGLISFVGPKLWIIGVVDLGLALVMTSIGFSISNRLVKSHLSFDRKRVNLKWARPILNMAGWSLVAALGFALFTRTDVWMINKFVSKEMAGVYAALLVWPNFIKQVSGQLSSLIGPVYMIDFAKDKMGRLIKTCLMASKIMGVFAAFAVGFVYIFSEPILKLWVGEVFVEYAPLLKLMVVGLVLTLGESVIWGIFPALDKTHYTGWANLATGVLNIVLSLILVKAGFGVYGVAVGTLVSIVIKCAIVIPYAAAKELGFSYSKFLVPNLKSLSIFLVLVTLCEGAYAVPGISLPGLLATFIVASAGMSLIAFRCVFSKEERSWFISNFEMLKQKVLNRG